MFNAAAIGHIESVSFHYTDKIDITYPRLRQHPLSTVSMFRTNRRIECKNVLQHFLPVAKLFGLQQLPMAGYMSRSHSCYAQYFSDS